MTTPISNRDAVAQRWAAQAAAMKRLSQAAQPRRQPATPKVESPRGYDPRDRFEAPSAVRTASTHLVSAPPRSSAEASTLMTEDANDSSVNCLDQAVDHLRGLSGGQRQSSSLILLSDSRPGSEGRTGHAVVQEGAQVVDPSSGKTYTTMQAYLGENPQYSEAGRLSGPDAERIFDAPPGSTERQRAMDHAGVSSSLRTMLVADSKGPIPERGVVKGPRKGAFFLDQNGRPLRDRQGTPIVQPARNADGSIVTDRYGNPATEYIYGAHAKLRFKRDNGNVVLDTKGDPLPYARNGRTPLVNHQKGARMETALARGIHQNIPDESVVSWGAPVRARHADVVSVNTKSGQVTLWDTKFRSTQGFDRALDSGDSPTFSIDARRQAAVAKAAKDIAHSTNLPADIKLKALENLKGNNYTTGTVGGGLYRRPPASAVGDARKAPRDEHFVDYENGKAQQVRRVPWTQNARPATGSGTTRGATENKSSGATAKGASGAAKSTGSKSPADGSASTPRPGTVRGAVKGGAAGGLVFGVGNAVYNAVKTGNVDVKQVAGTVATTTAAGATAGAVQHVVAKGIDKVAGNAVQTAASRLAGGSSAIGSAARSLAGKAGGGGVAGAVINAGFSAVDQVGKYQRGEVSGAKAIGTVAGEAAVGAAVGVGAGIAGAEAGAVIGSFIPIPGVGTVAGAVVGFGVGYLADKAMRAGGVDKLVANGVTGAVDGAEKALGSATNAVKNFFSW